MENKDKIVKLRAQIASLQDRIKNEKDMYGKGLSNYAKSQMQAKISELEAQIQKILEVGNGDGTGRPTTQKQYGGPMEEGRIVNI